MCSPWQSNHALPPDPTTMSMWAAQIRPGSLSFFFWRTYNWEWGDLVGIRRKNGEVNMIKLHYIHIWNSERTNEMYHTRIRSLRGPIFGLFSLPVFSWCPGLLPAEIRFSGTSSVQVGCWMPKGLWCWPRLLSSLQVLWHRMEQSPKEPVCWGHQDRSISVHSELSKDREWFRGDGITVM